VDSAAGTLARPAAIQARQTSRNANRLGVQKKPKELPRCLLIIKALGLAVEALGTMKAGWDNPSLFYAFDFDFDRIAKLRISSGISCLWA
jgi:hypothetical protein